MLIEKLIPGPVGRINVASSSERECSLLMLHGVTRRCQSFVRVASALSMRHQIHAVDFRGHGNSDRTTDAYRVIDYAEDALAVLDQLPDQPVFVYGHSLGAMVASIVAARRPDRVAGIVMEDPPYHTMGRFIEETVLLSFFSAMQQFAGDSRDVSEVAQDLANVVVRDPKADKEICLGDVRDAASLRFTASCLKQLDRNVFDSIIAGQWLDGFEIEQTLRNVKCPALLIQADVAAGGMLPDDVADAVADWAPDLTRVKVPGCGHLVHWSQTDQLLSYVHGFLESLKT